MKSTFSRLLCATMLFAVPVATAQTTGGIVETITLQNSADLTIRNVGFNGLGEVVFQLANRGDVGINTSQVPIGVAGSTLITPIRIDIHVGGYLAQSVYQQSLAGKASRDFVVKLVSNVPRCTESRDLRVTADSTNLVKEPHEDNNAVSGTFARPCPDMAIESIAKNFNSARTEYVATVTLVNKGTAEAKFRYMAMTQNNSTFTSLPAADFDKWLTLAPGARTKFTIGSAFAYEKMWVRVMLDRFSEVSELDESNNFVEKVLD